MSKKHSRKPKINRKRVPVSAAEEERYFQSKLAQLKEEMNSLEEHPTESKVIKKKSKSKEAINVAKKKVKEEKVAKVVEVEETEGNVVTAKDLADALGLTPLLLRKKLRSAGMEKPEGGRWEWPEDHPDVDTILGWKDEGEEVAEEKPAKKGKAKAAAEPPAKKGKGKKKVEPVVEEVEEDEEEDDDEEGIDLESMTLKELRELCDEEGIEYKKKDKKPALIEMLLESDGE